MRFARSVCWIFSGLMLVASGAYAEETASQTASKPKAPAKKTPVKKSAANKAAKAGAAALQAKHDAEMRAKAEQEARQRAEEEERARQRAEAEARKQAEIEAHEKPIRDAEEMMKAGKPADAYALLEPLEFDRAGEVRFDYLLGIAALDSGKPDKATLAFERVLAVDPNFAGARLDMARAYYQLGDMPRAKTEFETVQKQNPPEAARTTIQKYLDAIAAQEAARQTRIAGYVEGVVGNDSNVNSSTNQSQIAIPAFGNLVFTLSQVNQKAPDNYAGVAAGIEVNHMLNSDMGLYAGADVRQRSNMTQLAFDSLSLNGRAGVSYASESELFRLGFVGEQFTLSNDRNRNTTGLNGEWRHTFSPINQLNVFGQYSQNRFVGDTLRVNDFDQSVLGAGWLHVMNDGKAVAFASYYLGTENEVAPVTATNPAGGRADGNKRFDGIRVGGQAMVRDDLDLFANFGMQWGKYGKTNTAFLVKRDDRQEDVSLGANWHWDKLWTIRPQLTVSRNRSNIVIYAYDRTDFSITIRRDFK